MLGPVNALTLGSGDGLLCIAVGTAVCALEIRGSEHL
jgi:hypothetical protein